ncbi:lipid A-modifier LpxR family protein [Roseovarius nitratireducens]|uniref:lipid A-modifier LpxR family protein n=1 Tax=Roseovarius nitratireducens TaxID=2044597 RepID=UPI000CE1DA9E|nr:lipid A-modifier LpxR family protein [Roseovarius nitratireducens]
MVRLFAWALGVCLVVTGAAQAEGRYRVGYGLVFTNDIIGDGHDRWRSGSVASSRVYAPGWNGTAPARLGEMLELRFNGEIIAPDNVSTPAPGDRPFAGALSLGLHSHVARAGMEYAVGADLVVTGSQTGLDDFQGFLHDIVGGDDLSAGVRRNQVSDGFHPTAVVEAGRSFDLGAVRLRPFAEARVGIETLVRAGADITIGSLTRGELLVREPVTGQRYRVVREDAPGYAFILGADIAHVEDSELLPSRSGVQVEETRTRVRGGVHWEGQGGGAVFYGVTWLGEEFEGQREGQVVGSLQFRLRF